VSFNGPKADVPDITLCFQQRVQLFPNNQSYQKYEWSEGTIGKSMIAYKAGVYYVTATDSKGCFGVDTFTVTVLPQYLTIVDTTINIGESFRGFKTTGNYEDHFVSKTKCDSIVLIYLKVIDVSGVENLKTDEILVYPNPSAPDNKLDISGKYSEIKIYNQLGEMVGDEARAPKAKGIYYMKIATSKGIEIKKLLVN
jgi:hypothetical protein